MFLPSPIPGHDLATIIHHSVVDGPAVIFNALLLLAVVLRSPPSLRSYKVLLVNSAIIDLLSSLAMLLTMVRIVPATPVLGYIYDGPCAYVSGMFCHCVYTVMLATVSQSLFLIASSFAYRLYILGRPSPSNREVSIACLLMSIPNLIIIASFMFILDDPNDVRADLKALRPEYELDEYMIEGHTSIFNVITMFTILAMTMPIGPTLVLIFIMRKKVLTKLIAHSVQMSGRTAQMHNTLTRVLTLQSMLPVFFSGAVGSYGLCQFGIMCSPVQEHFIAESVSFMALLSPMITLYCMKPYKEFVISLARCDFAELKRSITSEASTTRVTELHTVQFCLSMYLPSPLPLHDLATIIHHSIVDSLAVIFNVLLFLAVTLRSPASLRSYKVLLLNSAIIDLISSFTALMTMTRLIPASTSIAYTYAGPCVYVSGILCHCLYTVMLASLSQSLFLIASSFAYRLYILGRPSPTGKAVFMASLLGSIPNAIILTTFMFILDDSADVRAIMKVLRPDYALDDYVVEGHASILNVLTLFTILAMTLPIGPTLIVIFIMRKKVLTKLVAHSVQMSGRTAQMHSTLTKVLTLQSLLPIFYSGAVASYALCQFDIVCSPVQEHFIIESISFMALFSPMITLYCMQPYKDFVVSLVRCNFAEFRRGSQHDTSTARVEELHSTM